MFDTALSGIDAAYFRMSVSAHNTANINTDGYKAYRVTQSELEGGGTVAHATQTDLPASYANEAVEQMVVGYSIRQNLVTVQTMNKMTGEVISMLA